MHGAIRPDDPVLHVEVRSVRHRVRDRLGLPLPILGMNRRNEIRVGERRVGLTAEIHTAGRGRGKFTCGRIILPRPEIAGIERQAQASFALGYTDRAYFLEKGEVRYDGDSAGLTERPDLLRSVFLAGASAGFGS